mmetsp:Transcript_12088/g.19521  ORF Transcript_12088/g.19521 Transcript_12088/m.19521 type:complete len:308 (-) Transcript_12088:44-967(-)
MWRRLTCAAATGAVAAWRVAGATDCFVGMGAFPLPLHTFAGISASTGSLFSTPSSRRSAAGDTHGHKLGPQSRPAGAELARVHGLTTGTHSWPRGRVAGSAGAGTATRNWHGRAPTPIAASSKVIIYAVGPDRPGLISAVTKAVLDARGNVEESRCARLGDDCNIMMLVSFGGGESSVERQAAIARAAEDIPGLQVTLRPTQAKRYADAVDHSRWRRILLHGTDFPGLVHQMTSYLSSEGINIEMLNTDTQPAPFDRDDFLFTIDAVIEIGPDTSLSKFKRSMDKLKQKLGVDIEISDHEAVHRHVK